MGVQTLEAGEKELKRLRKLKQEKMGDFILAARVRIRGGITEASNLYFPFLTYDHWTIYPTL